MKRFRATRRRRFNPNICARGSVRAAAQAAQGARLLPSPRPRRGDRRRNGRRPSALEERSAHAAARAPIAARAPGGTRQVAAAPLEVAAGGRRTSIDLVLSKGSSVPHGGHKVPTVDIKLKAAVAAPSRGVEGEPQADHRPEAAAVALAAPRRTAPSRGCCSSAPRRSTLPSRASSRAPSWGPKHRSAVPPPRKRTSRRYLGTDYSVKEAAGRGLMSPHQRGSLSATPRAPGRRARPAAARRRASRRAPRRDLAARADDVLVERRVVVRRRERARAAW